MVQDSCKNTALHLACNQGHETCAFLLLEKLENPEHIDSANAARQTPMHLAARKGLSSVVQDLINKGASVLALDENDLTPALACAPNKDVADCLAIILSTMMPFSSGVFGRRSASLGTFKVPLYDEAFNGPVSCRAHGSTGLEDSASPVQHFLTKILTLTQRLTNLIVLKNILVSLHPFLFVTTTSLSIYLLIFPATLLSFCLLFFSVCT
uniref:Uncharacterized protein n=1 Tax=Eptatretus burgeri TaxID=7764 RepID=A0A8C4QEJ4_EPTBU